MPSEIVNRLNEDMASVHFPHSTVTEPGRSGLASPPASDGDVEE